MSLFLSNFDWLTFGGSLHWVSDITYLPLADGTWAYLCAFQDVASKQVMGWHVAATMPEELVRRRRH